MVSRLRKGGLHHPSESTIKAAAALVAVHHYEDAPDPDTTLNIVRDMKRLWHANWVGAITHGPEQWPATPADLPRDNFAAMFPDGEASEPRHLDRMAWMLSKIVLRTSNKSLTKLPTSAVATPDATSASGVFELMRMFMLAQGNRIDTPGPRIEDVTADARHPRGCHADSRASGMLSLVGDVDRALPAVGPSTVEPAAAPLGTRAPATGMLALQDITAGAAVDAVRAMELAAAGQAGEGSAHPAPSVAMKRVGRPPKKPAAAPTGEVAPAALKGKPIPSAAPKVKAAPKGMAAKPVKAALKIKAAPKGKKIPSAAPKVKAAPKGKAATLVKAAGPPIEKTPAYQEHYAEVLKTSLKKKLGLKMSHQRAREACAKRFNIENK